MSNSFADVGDLQAGWRTLSVAESERAEVLLVRASAFIRATVRGIDDQIDDGDLDIEVPKAVACSMVKRAMQGPTDLDGVTQQQQTTGPFNMGVTFANPSGDLYMTKAEKRWLGVGVQRAFSVDLLAGDGS